MNLINTYSNLAGRILLSFIFVMAGVSKIGQYQGTQAYMDMMGVSGSLLPLVIITELVGGLAILFGYQTKIAAFLLAGFTLLAGFLFHFQLSDQMQSILFMKNLAIAGGLLLLVTHGAGALSVDSYLNRTRSA